MRPLIAAFLTLAFLAASSLPAKQHAPSAAETLSGYAEAWSKHDANRVAAYFADDAIYEDLALGEVHRGKPAIKKFSEGTFAALPGFAMEQRALIVGAEGVAMEWIMTGTERASGKKFSVRGVSIMDLEGGKIRRVTDYWNMAAFQRQIEQSATSGS